MTTRYDALILGGGPAGGASALLLARMGWKVGLVERKKFPRKKVCGEYLSATNWPLFHELGIGEEFRDLSGPAVTRVGLFTGSHILKADLPLPQDQPAWGRALSREKLDLLLLDKAQNHGAEIWQPFTATDLHREKDLYHCEIRNPQTGQSVSLQAPIIVAAHGSWDSGTLPTQWSKPSPRPDDLLGFKAHFQNTNLPDGLMPLLAFPGGYGGMVHTEEGRASISCCIRQDKLTEIRKRYEGDAGEAVCQYVMASCLGVQQALQNAKRDGPWLGAGPIRPGIRLHYHGGIFPVGNVAGEAHPVIAEGISMAMQSAWLLSQRLQRWKQQGRQPSQLEKVGSSYAYAWRRSFRRRIRASFVIAHWAMRPGAVRTVMPFLKQFPSLLSWGARWSGKASRVVLMN